MIFTLDFGHRSRIGKGRGRRGGSEEGMEVGEKKRKAEQSTDTEVCGLLKIRHLVTG